ncbi:FAD-binding oxidoreductase [Aeromicrobium sp.]
MKWIRPADVDYDEARKLFNAMIDRRPAVIAQCSTPKDVKEALRYAGQHSLPVAVRSGGHSVAGMSTNDGGLVIDVRPMKSISIDAENRTATVGGGVTWGELDRAAHAHGLAVTGGRVSTTGVSGFTLGGGSGWLERAYGLACDNLSQVDLVTAGTEEVRASATENPDLFWALHGGGGNFGVATSLTFDMHPIGESSLAGLMLWPAAAGRDVATAYRDFAPASSELLGSALVSLVAPPEEFVPEGLQNQAAIALAVIFAGSPDEGREEIRPLRDLNPTVDLVSPMPYPDFQCMIDDPPGLNNYWTADYHDDFPDPAVDVFLKYGASLPDASSQLLLAPWGGAVARVDSSSTPMTKRSAHWVSHPFAMWEDPDKTEASIEWARGFRREIADHATGGVYLNFIGQEGPDRIRAAFGDENYSRLTKIKRDFDPENVFQGNQNIPPMNG